MGIQYAEVEKYITKKLENDLPKNLYYHGVHHTIDVCNAAARLAKLEKLNDEETVLVKTAALFHDSGFIFKYYDNESLGVKMMEGILPTFNYTREQIDEISKLILVTSLPHRPENLLEQIMCDADLDYLGRDDFFSISHSLKREWGEYGKTKTLLQWYKEQLVFMQKHSWFTKSATGLRDEKKQNYIGEIKLLLGKLEKNHQLKKKSSEARLKEAVRDDLAIDKSDILKHVDIFSTTSDKIIREIASAMKVLFLKAGMQVIEKGELGTCMFIIHDGKVRVHDGIYDIAELGPGKFFGEISLLDTEPRSADVTAKTDCILLQLDQEDFSVVSHKYNDVARGIMRVLLGRLRSQNTKIIQELKEREKHLQALVDERTRELNLKNEKLESAYKDIKDSINYAKRIQQAILPSVHDIYKVLDQSFIYYRPKDIVSGDFYFFAEKHKKIVLGVADCTGHGVPGAFMSMIGHDLLTQIIIERGITSPADILNHLEAGIRNALKQDSEHAEANDGMDIALVSLQLQKKNTEPETTFAELEYAGAYRNLYLIRKNSKELDEVKADKYSIGGESLGEHKKFSNHTIPLHEGDVFYIFSDGYADQNGGSEDKKLKTKKFKEILIDIQKKSMKDQKNYLDNFITNWMGTTEQRDDILVIGVRVKKT